jgi:hypothetical protein
MQEGAFRRNLYRYAMYVFTFIAASAHAEAISCGNFSETDPEQLASHVKWGSDGVSPPAIGCSQDTPEKTRCDWSNAVVLDRIIPGRRLIVVDSNHETGKDEWDYVTVYGCRQGKVEAVFGNRYLYGATISKFSSDKIVIVSNEWNKDATSARAPYEKIETFAWDPKTQMYKRAGASVRIRRE